MTRHYLLTVAWPLLCERIKPGIVERLVPVPAVSVSLDEWIVAGKESRLWAVNVHAVDSTWTRFVANLGLVSQLPRAPGAVVDPRPVLDAYGVSGRVFASVVRRSDDVALVVDNSLNNLDEVVGNCFRGRCLFSAVADAVYAVCAGHTSMLDTNTGRGTNTGDCGTVVVRGGTDVTVEGNALQVAHCIATIRGAVENGAVNGQHFDRASSGRLRDGGQDEEKLENNISGGENQNIGRCREGTIGDTHMDSDSATSAAVAAVVTGDCTVNMESRMNGTADDLISSGDAALVNCSENKTPCALARLPKPWLKGNFMSMVREWELVCTIGGAEKGFSEEWVQLVRNNMSEEYWVMTRAVVRVLQLVRKWVSGRERWCLLPDALMKMINLVCAVCDRLTEIEDFMDGPSLGASNYGSMRECMADYVRSRIVQGKDVEDSSAMVAAVEGCLLNRLLEKLYPLIRPFVEYIPKESYCLMALALDPRFGSLASLISLNKKLLQGSRLVFEKKLHGKESEASDERVRKLVLSMLSRYDNEMMIPMMVSLNTKVGNDGMDMEESKSGADHGEEGLFAETFEPTEDWKNRQQLEGELSKFRSFKKNIARTASSAESLRWWENNAELFPNIATLFRKVVSVPSSYVPVHRILSSRGAKMDVTRSRLSPKGLEDMVYIHENLDTRIMSSIIGAGQASEHDAWQVHAGDVGLDDEELYELAPELFSS